MMEPRTPATRASWGGLDFSGPFVPIPWRGSFSESQFELIRLGAIPAEMEDRWFAFFEDPELFVHRSWTGFCIYRVTFIQAADRHVVQTALVSDNRNRTGASRISRKSSSLMSLLTASYCRIPASLPVSFCESANR